MRIPRNPTPSISHRKQDWAHASKPGTGPEGKTCRDCAHYCLVQPGANTFRKCGLMEHAWTHGPGTDIHARDPACRYFEERKD